MKWISVKEQLPQETLCFIFVCNIDYAAHKTAIATYYHSSQHFELFDCNCSSKLPISITHWMPIPLPPKD